LWAFFVAHLEVKQFLDLRVSLIGAAACVNTGLTDCFLRECAGLRTALVVLYKALFPRQGIANED
jgi:hypothetical protein